MHLNARTPDKAVWSFAPLSQGFLDCTFVHNHPRGASRLGTFVCSGAPRSIRLPWNLDLRPAAAEQPCAWIVRWYVVNEVANSSPKPTMQAHSLPLDFYRGSVLVYLLRVVCRYYIVHT